MFDIILFQFSQQTVYSKGFIFTKTYSNPTCNGLSLSTYGDYVGNCIQYDQIYSYKYLVDLGNDDNSIFICIHNKYNR